MAKFCPIAGGQSDSPEVQASDKFVLRPIRVFGVAALLWLLAVTPPLRPSAAIAEPGEDTAVEMLRDAVDALADADTELAREIFQQLILSYPGSSEAIRAEHELAVMSSRQSSGGGQGNARTDGQRAADAQLRRQFAMEVGDRVFFAANSATIGGRARVMLENQARWLRQHADLSIVIIGRSDDGVSGAGAVAMASERAEAVRARLVAGGVEATRISLDPRGNADPVATCRTPLCQAQNRMAETSIGSWRSLGFNDRPPIDYPATAAGTKSENRSNVLLPR